MRAGEPVETYFDEHLAALLETIYRFCGLPEKKACLDELTMYLLDCLPALSGDMRHDIEAMYKYNLTKAGTYGTVARSGKTDKLYYFAQTDPDWAGEIFEFEGNGATLKGSRLRLRLRRNGFLNLSQSRNHAALDAYLCSAGQLSRQLWSAERIF